MIAAANFTAPCADESGDARGSPLRDGESDVLEPAAEEEVLSTSRIVSPAAVPADAGEVCVSSSRPIIIETIVPSDASPAPERSDEPSIAQHGDRVREGEDLLHPV